MPIEVQGPDGSIVEFPDGTPSATIERAMRAKFGGPVTAALQPGPPTPDPRAMAGTGAIVYGGTPGISVTAGQEQTARDLAARGRDPASIRYETPDTGAPESGDYVDLYGTQRSVEGDALMASDAARRTALAAGIGDMGGGTDPANPTALKPYQRTLLERLQQNFIDPLMRGEGAIARAILPQGQYTVGEGNPDSFQADTLGQMASDAERERRDLYDRQSAADPFYKAQAPKAWTDMLGKRAGTLAYRGVAGGATLGGQVGGSLLDLTNLTTAGVGGGPGDDMMRYLLTQGAVNAGTDVPLQAADMATGVQDGYNPGQTGTAFVSGIGIGAIFEAAARSPAAARAIGDFFTRKGIDPATVSPETLPPDVAGEMLLDPDIAAILKASNVDPASPQFQPFVEAAQRRRAAEAARGDAPAIVAQAAVEAAPGGQGIAPDTAARLESLQTAPNVAPTTRTDIEATLLGDRDPATIRTTTPPTAPDIIPVDAAGRADAGDIGTRAGVDAVDAGMARQRAEAEQAFRMAELQRQRAAGDIRDTQTAGLPKGPEPQQVLLDDGFPVRVVEEQGNGKVKVQRYDPRTGALDPEAVPYDTSYAALSRRNYTPEPRRAQDFGARDGLERAAPELPRMDGQGVRREPTKTYQTTPQDAPPAEGPFSRETGRPPLPEQPGGPGPWRDQPGAERAQRFADEAQARARWEQRQQESQYQEFSRRAREQYAGSDAKTSSTAAPADAESRFTTDEFGFVKSDKGGPIRFGDQKQAAKWILNVGQKQSPDQVFEIANHPKGGFTARETGRSTSSAGSEKAPPNDGASQSPESSVDQRSMTASPEAGRAPGSSFENPKAPTEMSDSQPANTTPMPGKLQTSVDDSANSGEAVLDANSGSPRGNGSQPGEPTTGEAPRGHPSREEIGSRQTTPPPTVYHGSPYGKIDRFDSAESHPINGGHFFSEDAGVARQFAEEAARDTGDSDLSPDVTAASLDVKRPAITSKDVEAPMTIRQFFEEFGLPVPEHLKARQDAPNTMWGIYRNEDGVFEALKRGGYDSLSAIERGARMWVAFDDAQVRPDAGKAFKDMTPDERVAYNKQWNDENFAALKEQEPDLTREQYEARRKAGMSFFKSYLESEDGSPPDAPDANPGTKLYSGLDPEAVNDLLLKPGVKLVKEEVDGFKEDLARLLSDIAGFKANAPFMKPLETAAKVMRAVLWTKTAAMRAIAAKYPNVPEIREMVDAIGTDPGRGRNIKQTFERAVQMVAGGMTQRLDNIFGPKHDPAFERKVADILSGRRRPLSGTREASVAQRIRALLDEQHAYLKEAGVETGYVKGKYYPRVVDVQAVLRAPAAFKEKAASLYRKMGLSSKEASEAADDWYHRIMGVTDPGGQHGTPASKFTKGRTLPPEADSILADFYVNNPRENLAGYFRQTARAAEFTRRFGKNGEKADEAFNAMLKKGVEEDDVNTLRDNFRGATGTLYSTRPSAVSGALGWIQTAGILGTLPRAVISSLAETLTIGVKAHDVRAGLKATVLAWSDMLKIARHPEDAVRLSEFLGLTGHALNDMILHSHFDGNPGTRAQQKLQSRFFRTFQLEGVTASQRIAALRIGQGMLRELINDVGGTRRRASALRLLNELGIDEPMAKSLAGWLPGGGKGVPMGEMLSSKPEAVAYRTALQRFVDESIQNPTAADRPLWAEHPYGRFAYGITSFTFSFTRNVLLPVMRDTGEGIFGKGYTPEDRLRLLSVLPAMVMLSVAQTQIGEWRDNVFSPDAVAERTKLESILTNVSRTGVFGNADTIVNLILSLKYQRSATTLTAGPYLGQWANFIQKIGALLPKKVNGEDFVGSNSDRTNNAEWGAAKAAYRAIASPLASAVASYLPGGPLMRLGYGVGGMFATSPEASNDFADKVVGPRTVIRGKPKADSVDGGDDTSSILKDMMK